LCSNIDEEEFHIKEIIHQFDGNGDGLIDEEEFLSCLRSISEMFVEQEYLKKQSMAKIEEEQLRLEDKEKSKQ
jgi:Ca2+-binding EF-hand superfamily protein